MEIWKPINGYENFYEISNYGRVRSLDRIVYFKNHKGSRKYKGKILRQKYHNGYALINLNKNKQMEVKYIHRLVAEHFLPNIKNLPCVKHKDGVKSNNCVDNLEWCTFSENNQYALNLRKNNIENKQNSIKVACYKNNKLIHISNNSRELAKWLIENTNELQTKNIETISRSIRKKSQLNKDYYGFIFKRVFIEQEIIENKEQIIILKDKEIIGILNASKVCARWLLENKYISEVTEDTIARQIRKIINTEKTYHNFQFQKLS